MLETKEIKGDRTVIPFTNPAAGEQFGSVPEATPEEIKEAYNQLDPYVVECLKAAARNIIKFHKAQLEREMWSIEVREGILAGRVTRAMDIVGCYIPGGSAIYPSSILMTVR